MRRRVLLTVAAGLLAAQGALADAGEDFHALLDEAWEWHLRQNPMVASRAGDRRYNTEWRDQSLGGIELRHLQRRNFLSRLNAIDEAALSEADQLNYELFRRDLQRRVEEGFVPYLEAKFSNKSTIGVYTPHGRHLNLILHQEPARLAHMARHVVRTPVAMDRVREGEGGQVLLSIPPDHRTGATVAEVSSINAGIIRKDLRRIQTARDALKPQMPIRCPGSR